MAAKVIDVLRRFLPGFVSSKPSLLPVQRRAIWAILHCRTAAMGGRLFACEPCGTRHFAYHSCNHKACPQCGKAATARWVKRELGKLIGAPYFMVTFTLPAELRELFFGPHAKAAYDLFFAAASGALAEKLAHGKGLHAEVNGFTGVLHTWNQRLLFHPHLHSPAGSIHHSQTGKSFAQSGVADGRLLLKSIRVIRKAIHPHLSSDRIFITHPNEKNTHASHRTHPAVFRRAGRRRGDV